MLCLGYCKKSLSNLNKIKSHVSIYVDSNVTGEEIDFTYSRNNYVDIFNIKTDGLYFVNATIANADANDGNIYIYRNSNISCISPTERWTSATVTGCYYLKKGEIIKVSRESKMYTNIKCQQTIFIKLQ